jgi:rhodanese-related sulfurtransferase
LAQAKLKYETDSWDLSESIQKNEGIVVVDARSSEAYEVEHIPSAINIPHRNMSAKIIKDLDKSKIYVTYCDGIGCNASTKGAVNLAKLGFKVKERDGYATEGKHGVDGKKIVCGC